MSALNAVGLRVHTNGTVVGAQPHVTSDLTSEDFIAALRPLVLTWPDRQCYASTLGAVGITGN